MKRKKKRLGIGAWPGFIDYLFDEIVGIVLLLDGDVHVAPGSEMDGSRTTLGDIVLDLADLGEGDHADMLVLDGILEPLLRS